MRYISGTASEVVSRFLSLKVLGTAESKIPSPSKSLSSL